MMPRPPDALVDDAIRCPCTAGGQPWCVRCECLIQLALARDVWVWEQVTGMNWWQAMVDKHAVEVERMRHIGGLRGAGYTALGWACEAWAYTVYFAWILPRMAWLRYTGQIPLPPLGTRLPVRLRERAWCTVCERTLEAGTVRCPEHPNGEVMLVLRDEAPADMTEAEAVRRARAERDAEQRVHDRMIARLRREEDADAP